MSASPRSAKDLFVAALEIADPTERAAFLDRECATDSQVRERVNALLRAHDNPASVVERPLVAPAAADPTGAYSPEMPPTGTFGAPDATSDYSPRPDAGAVLGGKYKLVEEIGEGGMGTVWVAQQTEPVKRVVAVKLIKAGMDSRAVLARFEAERQALALMDHPNIARVLDGGTAPDGRPYFVMELVKGAPITTYCDQRRLPPRERLELFIPVCQAIQHAHQKGIIHRDIKPNNVLIALYDDKPVPKVIDFGIAKATGQVLTDKTLLTGFGAVVGTPEYMSPEQANLNNLDIDTRSDVYALGVLLYELLAGSPPFRSDELKKAGLLEVLRLVREVEPPRPSTKLSTASTLPSISAARGTEPKKLAGLLRGDLDWIVMRALEKDRGRRYESASSFAADVQRHLAGEAVQAHPPTAAYRLRTFARKHRGALLIATAFAALLLAATGVSGWLAVKARRAEGEADGKRVEAERSATEATERTEEAMYYLGFLDGVLEQEITARNEADLAAKSTQVDLDLSDGRGERGSDLLRMARRLKEWDPIPAVRTIKVKKYGTESTFRADEGLLTRDRALREFVTAAVLVSGQAYASLLSPLNHDGTVVVKCQISPDGKTVLTRGEDGTARLWDTRSGRTLAVLREANERVKDCGFSPDGRTLYTDDDTDTLRFWDAPGGIFRARSEPRPYALPKAHRFARLLSVGNDRVLKVLRAHNPSDLEPGSFVENSVATPVELWDTRTGRLVAQLNTPAWFTPERRRAGLDAWFLGDGRRVGLGEWLVGDGRWVVLTAGSEAVAFSASDGRKVARLDTGGKDQPPIRAISEGNGIIGATSRGAEGSRLHLWDTDSWLPRSYAVRVKAKDNLEFAFATKDEFGVYAWDDFSARRLFTYRYDSAVPVAEFPRGLIVSSRGPLQVSGVYASEDGEVFDARTRQRLRPPADRRYHPALAHFAWEGRIARLDRSSGGSQLIDLPTEKPLLVEDSFSSELLNLVPTPGALISSRVIEGEATFRLIPTNRLDVPPALLELWAQVAVRGELGRNGEFVKWNEEKWESKRQELAAAKPPHPDLPFPGHVVTDKLHWLRDEFYASEDDDKLRIAGDLLRRAEGLGDGNEAARWRREIERRVPALAPPPRQVKR